MEAGMLELLVKLASLGTSGICIFAIFWTGSLLRDYAKRPTQPEMLQTLRYYMGVCVVIAIVSATSGGVNAYFNANTINKLEGEKKTLAANFQTKSDEYQQLKLAQQKQADQMKAQEEKFKLTLANVETVLKSKAAITEQHGNDQAVKESIKALQEIVRSQQAALRGD